MRRNLLRMSMLCLLAMMALVGKAQGDVAALWDFKNVNPSTLKDMSFQGTTGTVASTIEGIELYVDATNGKLHQRDNDAQFNSGTIIRVPVKSAGDEVTVVSYPGYHNYTVAGTAAANDTETYKAVAADAKAGYVEIVGTGSSYLHSIQVVQKAASGSKLVEKALIDTDFQDWTKSSTTSEIKTRFTEETITFTYVNTTVDPEATNDGKFPIATDAAFKGYILADKKEATVTTSAFKNITKIRYRHGATGSNRGWGLKIKAEGDADWTTVSSEVTNGNAWIEKSINKENVQLQWYNLNTSQNAYMFELEIYGNVDLSGAPLLGSFKVNDNTYTGDDFEMGNDGNYAATFELFSSEQMVSSSTNPLKDVTADNGEIGTITYDGDADKCKVTIPVTANGQTVNYIANFIRKPLIKLTYIGADGNEIGQQDVEKDTKIGSFKFNISDVAASKEGWKARGWFKQSYVGEKYTTESIISESVKLYAVETEIEGASLSRKYEFDLRNKNFDPADHEAFSPTGGEWHDTTHGWVFSNGNKIDVLVGPKANVSFTVCAFSNKDAKLTIGDTELPLYDETDGKLVSYTHNGEAGTLTFTVSSPGAAYIHSVKIVNTSSKNYDVDGNKYTVKAGDASSFIDALDAVNGESGTGEVILYLPNGTYNLGNACLTTIGRDNVKIIGESQDGVVIQNKPTTEGIGVTATLLNTSKYLTLENLTLKNAYPYYDPSTGKASASAGRAVCLQDKGNYTVCKNVTMLSYQDTYYSSNNNGYFYFTNCDIHGLVDFVCGGGDVFFENTTFTLESREMTEGKGEVTIAAPNNAKQYGYVMSNCVVDCKSATFNWGRAWDAPSRLAWLNTTLKQPEKIISTRFTPAGMNVAADAFYEYKTKDEAGKVISPATNIINFTHSTGNKEFETILTDKKAADFTKAKVFASTPDEFKTRVGANTDGIKAIDAAKTDARQQADAIYTLQGVRVSKATKGIYIINGKKVVIK